MPENPSEEQHRLVWERRQTELWDRIFQVTQDVVTLAEIMRDIPGGSVIEAEMVKSAMNVGRQVVRATAADSGGHFTHYLEEARLAAVETDYWLRMAYMLQQREEIQQDLSSMLNQYSAIIDLLQKMIRHAASEKDVMSRHGRGPRVS